MRRSITPKRATTSLAASVRAHRSSLAPRDYITVDERGAMVRNRLSSGLALVPGPRYGFLARSNLGPTRPVTAVERDAEGSQI